MAIDYKTLDECRDGVFVTDKNRRSIYKLASVGFIHLGTHTEMNDIDEKIRLRETAKTTAFGLRVLKQVQPSLFERAINRIWEYKNRV